MNRRLTTSLLAIFLLVVITCQPPSSMACGPFTLTAVFTFKVHPEYPLEKFAAGEIGVVQPTYARSYLYVAYRYLSEREFQPQEQKALVDLWRERLDLRWPGETAGIQTWQTARAKVLNAGAPPAIDVYRYREKPNQYETYLNCQNDAFDNAAATLNERINKLGADNPLILDWVTAQDQVFANCGEGKNIPSPAPDNADAVIKSDRTYQIAAANFYAGDFAAAKGLFAEIARDNNSPWQRKAPYLLARSLVREASLNPPENKSEPLAAAEKQLNEILKNASLSETHGAAKRLLGLVRLRLHPEVRTAELGQSLLETNANERLKQELWDYTVLLDQLLGDIGEGPTKSLPDSLRNDELTDWIVTFQSQHPDSLEHSIREFEAKSSVPWLLATLTKINAGHPQIRSILDAASRVTPGSAAYPTAFFHRTRLLIDAQRFEEARAALDEALKNNRNRFTVSGLNLALSQRMLLANSLEDFLVHAQRRPAAFSYDDDGREIPDEDESESSETKLDRNKPLLDGDAAHLLNKKFPLELLKQAALSRTLAPHLRRDVAQAAWLRAVLLGDSNTASELVPVVKSLIPEATTLLDEYLSATQGDAKTFAAIYTWLKFPGFEPVVDVGIGRQTPLGEQETYRDNWWCTAAFPEPAQDEAAGTETLKINSPYDLSRTGAFPLFVTSDQRAEGQRQYEKLSALGAAPNYLTREAIQWATKNPSDPRAPEALHLAVRTTRYGCTDKLSARWSKAAFDILHRRYPRSVWAKKTPYWFKD